MTRLCHQILVRNLARFFLSTSCRGYCSQTKLLPYLNKASVQKYLNRMENEITQSPSGHRNNVPHQVFMNLYAARRELLSNLDALKGLQGDGQASKEMSDMIAEEETKYKVELVNVESELFKCFAPPVEDGDEITVEVTAGVGGKEAALFCKELFEMYCNYAEFKSWNTFVDQSDISELGGIRHARIYMEGDSALQHLIQESGVHRVQRIPATERSGRIHTSTVTVAVIPITPLVEIQIADRDIVVDTMRSSGAGGQHVNRTDSAVRITHLPSGLVVECQEDRSQIRNRQTAMQRLKMRLNERMQQEHDNKVRGSRKSQVGTSARSDKVRTYNFPQDRVTDHRLSQNIHNVPGFLKGEELLDNTIAKLIAFSEEERINSFLESIKRDDV